MMATLRMSLAGEKSKEGARSDPGRSPEPSMRGKGSSRDVILSAGSASEASTHGVEGSLPAQRNLRNSIDARHASALPSHRPEGNFCCCVRACDVLPNFFHTHFTL